ncbi:MAG: hypothetical protein D6773_11875 [Alphaproteobacteria bacterium]|nr:MAG: hypothetical protein D6773_11875 [Alphaproteobacteria bacterium]
MKWHACLALIAAASLSAGCARASVGCEGFKPIRGTKADAAVISDRLAESIIAHNRYGARVCGWKP